MGKDYFIERLSQKCGITKKAAREIYNNFIDVLYEMLIETGTAKLHRFATFTIKDAGERTLLYINGEHKGKEYTVPPKKKIKAKVSLVVKRKFETETAKKEKQ